MTGCSCFLTRAGVSGERCRAVASLSGLLPGSPAVCYTRGLT